MRIALIVPGGIGRDTEHHVIPALMWLIERLARRHDVHVIALRQERQPASWHVLGANVHNIGAAAGRLGALRTILRLHAERTFDIFHAIWAGDPGEIGLAAARMTRRPFVVHCAGGEFTWLPDIAFGSTPARQARARFVVRHADRVTAASSVMLDAARAAGCHPIRVPLGVDTALWTPQPPRPRETDRPARVVHIGSITPVKDHAMLLHAVARMKERVQVDLIGEDTSNGVVQDLARDIGIADRVTFHGYLPQARALPIVRAADIMAVTSRHEAGPVAMLEAAACGVPTIGTPVGHVRDWAPDAALQVPFGDADAFAAAAIRLLLDDPRRIMLARRAQELALHDSADWTSAQFEQIYTALVQPHPRQLTQPVPGK